MGFSSLLSWMPWFRDNPKPCRKIFWSLPTRWHIYLSCHTFQRGKITPDGKQWFQRIIEYQCSHVILKLTHRWRDGSRVLGLALLSVHDTYDLVPWFLCDVLVLFLTCKVVAGSISYSLYIRLPVFSVNMMQFSIGIKSYTSPFALPF